MNDHGTPDTLDGGEIFGIAVIGEARPAFGVPLVRTSTAANATYIQLAEHSRRVSGFEICTLGETEILPLEERRKIALGDEQLFGFIDSDGHPLLGTRRETAPRVRRWLREIEFPLTRLAFAEFCEHGPESVRAARAAFRQVAVSSNRAAAMSWFASSIVFRRLHLAALDAAVSLEDVAEAEHALSRLDFEINDGTLVAVVAPPLYRLLESARAAKSPHFLSAMKLAAEVSQGLFVIEERPARAGRTQPAGRRAPSSPPVDVMSLPQAIASAGRQEARVALLLRAIAADAGWAARGVEAYRPRTRFEHIALRIIKQHLGPELFDDAGEYRVAIMISEIFRSAYPMSRGRLLHDLADQLSTYEILNRTIWKIADSSSSMFIDEHRRAISKFLREGRLRGRPSPVSERAAILKPPPMPLFERIPS